MEAELIIACGSHKGEVVKVDNDVFLIGRSSKADLRVKSDSVSRKHCAIIARQGKVYVADMESRNGTIINGTKIPTEKKVRLQDGDILQVGKMKLIIQIVESKSPDDGLSVVLKNQTPLRRMDSAETKFDAGKQTVDQHSLTVDGIDFSGWNTDSKELDSAEIAAIGDLASKSDESKKGSEESSSSRSTSEATNFDSEDNKNSLALIEEEERRRRQEARNNRKAHSSQEAASDAIRRMLGGGR
ncbi:MAG: FHA domain-containing protein [Pirellulaceae bacterium]